MNRTQNIPYKTIVISALGAMTIISSLGLNAMSTSASQVNKPMNASIVFVNNESSNYHKYMQDINNIVRNDNINYIPSSSSLTPDVFSAYGLSPDVVGHAMAGDVNYQHVLAQDLTHLDAKIGEKVIRRYQILRSHYLMKHPIPTVTATRAGNVYKDVKLTKKTDQAFVENDLLKIKRIWSVRGKQRFELTNGNFISGYHAVINQDFTSPRMIAKLFKHIKYVGCKPTRLLTHKYYVRTPRGKHHAAITKKSVVKHTNASFGDLASLKQRNHVRKGIKFHFRHIIRHGDTFRLQLTNGRYITANKAYVRVIK